MADVETIRTSQPEKADLHKHKLAVGENTTMQYQTD